jgi:hypothetical protein
MFGFAFHFLAAAAVPLHLTGISNSVLPIFPGMNKLVALIIAARTDSYLLAVLIVNIAPVATMKAKRAFAFTEQVFQHVRRALILLPKQAVCVRPSYG